MRRLTLTLALLGILVGYGCSNEPMNSEEFAEFAFLKHNELAPLFDTRDPDAATILNRIVEIKEDLSTANVELQLRPIAIEMAEWIDGNLEYCVRELERHEKYESASPIQRAALLFAEYVEFITRETIFGSGILAGVSRELSDLPDYESYFFYNYTLPEDKIYTWMHIETLEETPLVDSEFYDGCGRWFRG